MEEIIEFTFQYLHILRTSGIAEWIFDEVRGICNTMFHFRDKIPPINYVTSIASKLELYPPQDWLVASSLPSNFNPHTIQMVLDQLVPNKSRIFWASKQFEGQTNEIEPWYGTAFSVEKIKDDLVKQWEVSQPDTRLGLPLPNVFIPTDLTLKQVEEKVKHPVLLRKSEFSRLWYKPDTMFFTPKAYIKLDFNCPESNCSPEPEVLTNDNGIDLGTTQLGEKIDVVKLPPWANSPIDFIHKHRTALESEHVSAHLNEWIDLIFGYKQRGKEAVAANNVFFYMTYEGAVDIDKISDPVLRHAAQDQIAYFGQTPSQLLTFPHVKRRPLADVLHLQTIFRNPTEIKSYVIPNPERCNVPASAISASADSIIIVDTNLPAAHVALHRWQPNTPDGHGMPFLFQHGKAAVSSSGGAFMRIFKGSGIEDWHYPCCIAFPAPGIRSSSVVAITSDMHIITGGHADNTVKLILAENELTKRQWAEAGTLLGDCLLSAVKVLMNLTNDNPIGCHQVAVCGGLDTMASLIVDHYPLFQCHLLSSSKRTGKDTSTESPANGSCNEALSDQDLDLLVVILGVLVNLVEKDTRNRSK